MIFLTDKKKINNNKIQFDVYESLEDLSQRVEWQDILDPSIMILDSEGKIYVWDDSKQQELGTVYDYSFKVRGTDLNLADQCNTMYGQLGQPNSFEIELD